MSSETAIMAEQCRLREWAEQIRDCQGPPAGMSVVGWCTCHGIIKANYYYQLRRVREACLETIQEIPAQQMVPVQPGLLRPQGQKDSGSQPRLDISIRGFSIHVTESTSMPLLTEVLKALQHVE